VAALCRCVRELLFNVVKHSGVLQARIVVFLSGGDLAVQVVDAGEGFSTCVLHEPLKSQQCFGLSNVRQRLAELGGAFQVKSHRGTGTTVTLAVPVTHNGPTSPRADLPPGNAVSPRTTEPSVPVRYRKASYADSAIGVTG